MNRNLSALVAGSLGVAAATVPAQQYDAPQFANPVRLSDDQGFVAEQRIYPSPVFHDVDGDGIAELVIGDLRGFLTMTRRDEIRGDPKWESTASLLGADGEPLKFRNW